MMLGAGLRSDGRRWVPGDTCKGTETYRATLMPFKVPLVYAHTSIHVCAHVPMHVYANVPIHVYVSVYTLVPKKWQSL